MLTLFEFDDRQEVRIQTDVDDLIAAAQAGDRHAFGALIELLSDDLHKITRRTVYSNRIDPLDIFQDSVLQAMHSIHALRNRTRAGFLCWFSGIARNRVLTLKASGSRRGKPNKKTPYPWERMEQIGPEHLELSALADTEVALEDGLCPLTPILTELAPVTRVGWLLREVFGMEWDSVALVLRKDSLAAARQTHYRALQTIGQANSGETQAVSAGEKPLGWRP